MRKASGGIMHKKSTVVSSLSKLHKSTYFSYNEIDYIQQTDQKGRQFLHGIQEPAGSEKYCKVHQVHLQEGRYV